jgi:hypothetical protein
MVKRHIGWEFYLISGLITVAIMLGGVFFGVWVSGAKIDLLEQQLRELRLRQEDMTIQFLFMHLLGNQTCDVLAAELSEVIIEATKLADELDRYEGDPLRAAHFEFLKKDYTLTLIRYWYYLERLKAECGKTDFITVLYFYSNLYCVDCPQQGHILTYLKRLYPQAVMNFALDADLDLNIIRLLKSVYRVRGVPTLVIDGRSYEGLVSLEQLKQILCEKLQICE